MCLVDFFVYHSDFLDALFESPHEINALHQNCYILITFMFKITLHFFQGILYKLVLVYGSLIQSNFEAAVPSLRIIPGPRNRLRGLLFTSAFLSIVVALSSAIHWYSEASILA